MAAIRKCCFIVLLPEAQVDPAIQVFNVPDCCRLI
jgi:hypothetical protein